MTPDLSSAVPGPPAMETQHTGPRAGVDEGPSRGPAGPGLFPDVPLAAYLRWDFLSQSVLKEGRASPAHLRAALDGERVKVPTDEMLRNSAMHCAFLEPELMPDHVVLWDGPRRAGKEWEAFRLEHSRKIILTAGMYETMIGMVRSLRRHPFVREWIGRTVATEVACVGEIDGVPFKGRVDAFTDDPLVDLKGTRSADPRIFTRTAVDFCYYIQGWCYRKLFGRDRWVLLAVEDSPPYDVVAYELSPAFIRAGEREALRLLQRYKECLASGAWPGRSDQVVTLEPPLWLDGGAEIILPEDEPADDTAVVMLGGLTQGD